MVPKPPAKKSTRPAAGPSATAAPPVPSPASSVKAPKLVGDQLGRYGLLFERERQSSLKAGGRGDPVHDDKRILRWIAQANNGTTLQPPEHAFDRTMPSYALKFDFKRFVPKSSEDIVQNSRGPQCKVKVQDINKKGQTTEKAAGCHIKKAQPAFLYTHDDVKCDQCREDNVKCLIYRFEPEKVFLSNGNALCEAVCKFACWNCYTSTVRKCSLSSSPKKVSINEDEEISSDEEGCYRRGGTVSEMGSVTGNVDRSSSPEEIDAPSPNVKDVKGKKRAHDSPSPMDLSPRSQKTIRLTSDPAATPKAPAPPKAPDTPKTKSLAQARLASFEASNDSSSALQQSSNAPPMPSIDSLSGPVDSTSNPAVERAAHVDPIVPPAPSPAVGSAARAFLQKRALKSESPASFKPVNPQPPSLPSPKQVPESAGSTETHTKGGLHRIVPNPAKSQSERSTALPTSPLSTGLNPSVSNEQPTVSQSEAFSANLESVNNQWKEAVRGYKLIKEKYLEDTGALTLTLRENWKSMEQQVKLLLRAKAELDALVRPLSDRNAQLEAQVQVLEGQIAGFERRLVERDDTNSRRLTEIEGLKVTLSQTRQDLENVTRQRETAESRHLTAVRDREQAQEEVRKAGEAAREAVEKCRAAEGEAEAAVVAIQDALNAADGEKQRSTELEAEVAVLRSLYQEEQAKTQKLESELESARMESGALQTASQDVQVIDSQGSARGGVLQRPREQIQRVQSEPLESVAVQTV